MKASVGHPDLSQEIAARMERLPITGFTWRVVVLGSLAWVIESLSIGALGVVLPILKPLWTLGAGSVGMLAISSTIGIVIGLIPAGYLADGYGRKSVLFWGILEYGGFTLLSAASPSYAWLVAFRFLSGLGMGAVFPLPYALISEFVPKHRRTLFNGIMDSSLSAGYFIAPLLGLLVLPHFAPNLAWRGFMCLSGLPVVFALIIRRYLPESPRWLSRHGHADRAFHVLSLMEAKARRKDHRQILAPVEASRLPAKTAPPTATGILGPWHRPLVRRTVVLAAAASGTFFMFYIVMTYLPLFFFREGFSFAASLRFTALITAAAIPGKLLNGLLGETIGRKWMYVIFMGIAGLAAIFFGLARTPSLMLAYGALMSFFGTGTFPVLKMSYAEQYPTPLRTTGAATVETIGRFLGGVVGPYAFPTLIAAVGLGRGFDLVSLVALISVAITLAYGQESKQASLEDLEARLH